MLCVIVCPIASPQATDPQASKSPDSKAPPGPVAPDVHVRAAPAEASKPAPKKKSRRTKSRKLRSSARSRRDTLRYRKMHQACVGSSTLKPMALQLLQNRVPAAYAGVEAFARRHNGEDAGSLAWLAVGYAYFLDHQYPKSIESLNRAKPHAGEIGDYVAFYLASSQLQSGRSAEALASLSKFDEDFPESLFIRDAP